jgi:hypothetical protein
VPASASDRRTAFDTIVVSTSWKSSDDETA